MMICPDCNNELVINTGKCNFCSWALDIEDNIPIYLSNHDKRDVMFNRYLDNYDDISVDDLDTSIQNIKYLESQNEKLFTYLPPLQGLKVCEIGVGKGALLELILKENPAKLVGVDVSRPYLKTIKSKFEANLELILANAENIPFANEFDVIIAADIIEHVFNVGDFLTSVNRALKLNGHFIVKTPHNEDINGYSKLRGCKYNFVHLRNFNKRTLTTVLNGAGFDVKKIIFDGFYPDRLRAFIQKNTYLNNKCIKYLNKKFEDVNDVNRIKNYLGNALMNPMEITAVTTKRVDLIF